jgi:hypothetical protein
MESSGPRVAHPGLAILPILGPIITYSHAFDSDWTIPSKKQPTILSVV